MQIIEAYTDVLISSTIIRDTVLKKTKTKTNTNIVFAMSPAIKAIT